MEEVWKDMSLTSLDHPTTTVASTVNNPDLSNIILQDFLGSRPFSKDHARRGGSGDTSMVPPPPPATVLSLNSASDIHCIDIGDPARQNPPVNGGASFFDALGSPTVFPPFCKKRTQEFNDSSHDRRHKRMMKNRESAARSRARKQAYTNELELEIAHLQEENARLRRQLEKFLVAPAQLPKGHTLQRSLTAPY